MPPVLYVTAAYCVEQSLERHWLCRFGQFSEQQCNSNMLYLQESLVADLVRLPLHRPPQQRRMGVSHSSLQTLAQQVTVLSVLMSCGRTRCGSDAQYMSCTILARQPTCFHLQGASYLMLLHRCLLALAFLGCIVGRATCRWTNNRHGRGPTTLGLILTILCLVFAPTCHAIHVLVHDCYMMWYGLPDDLHCLTKSWIACAVKQAAETKVPPCERILTQVSPQDLSPPSPLDPHLLPHPTPHPIHPLTYLPMADLLASPQPAAQTASCLMIKPKRCRFPPGSSPLSRPPSSQYQRSRVQVPSAAVQAEVRQARAQPALQQLPPPLLLLPRLCQPCRRSSRRLGRRMSRCCLPQRAPSSSLMTRTAKPGGNAAEANCVSIRLTAVLNLNMCHVDC